MNLSLRPSILAAALCTTLLAACERPPIESLQTGYRGTGMVDLTNPRLEADTRAANVSPAAAAAVPAEGPLARDVYQNVQVLDDLSVAEFTRLMVAMTEWVSPNEGCTYCHQGENFAVDAPYTKVVSRRMLEMTRHINSDWKSHVGETGVTCFTCHRGEPVPKYVWYNDPGPQTARGMAGNLAGQNVPAAHVGLTSLPFDSLTPFLGGASEIRVESTTALPDGNDASIMQTEWTYGLMIHMSEALGVNCTYCHNSRQFAAWDESNPARLPAWHGIRMARDLNEDYLVPLKSAFPAERLGTLGDVPKVSCATCHQGVAKPLYGESLIKAHPELVAKRPVPPPAPPADATADDTVTSSTTGGTGGT
jgi:photosynthetic reaction center cytochrome c subunit